MAKQDGSASSMRHTFPGYFRPTDEEFNHLWEDGMFVVDTNVLLNLYRYSHVTRDELLGVLRALKDKLFLPHQVGQEFLDRRLATIRSQRVGFEKLRTRVTSVRGDIEGELREVLRLRPGENLPDGLRDALEEVPQGGYASLAGQLEALEKELPRASNDPDDDKVWAAVEDLVDGKVGRPYQQEEQREAEAEAERRRDAKVPPGFKDKGPGDYLIWSQTMNEAKRSEKPVVFVTDDRKRDWWWRTEQGETIGPHADLVAEIREEARVPFYMYTPDRLMEEARKRLDVKVSDESISEAEGLDRESADDAAQDRMSWWHFDAAPHLTERERAALTAYFDQDHEIENVANKLGISYSATVNLLDGAMAKYVKWQEEEERPYHFASGSTLNLIRTGVEEQNRPLNRAQALVTTVYVTVRGDQEDIVIFTKTLLRRLPVTIDREPADPALGDATLILRFQSPVPIEHVNHVVQTAANHTTISLSTVTYSQFVD
jgi:predicted nucleic acid-binding protein